MGAVQLSLPSAFSVKASVDPFDRSVFQKTSTSCIRVLSHGYIPGHNRADDLQLLPQRLDRHLPSRRVRPRRAALTAANTPAVPAPTTITSYAPPQPISSSFCISISAFLRLLSETAPAAQWQSSLMNPYRSVYHPKNITHNKQQAGSKHRTLPCPARTAFNPPDDKWNRDQSLPPAAPSRQPEAPGTAGTEAFAPPASPGGWGGRRR